MASRTIDRKVLSYDDVVLRQSDLEILGGKHFLSDRIIEFYFSYLSSSYSTDDIKLVPPSIAYWIQQSPSPEDVVRPLNLPQKKLVFFPVNDNPDASMAWGGNHWSLLVFEKSTNLFVHHDSSSGNLNRYSAKQLYEAICPYISGDASFAECTSTPKQVNGYDCGLYVIAFARVICDWFKNASARDVKDLWFAELDRITPSAVSGLRGEILSLIKSLMVKE